MPIFHTQHQASNERSGLDNGCRRRRACLGGRGTWRKHREDRRLTKNYKSISKPHQQIAWPGTGKQPRTLKSFCYYMKHFLANNWQGSAPWKMKAQSVQITSQYVDKPKRRQPQLRWAETSTNRNVDKPKHRQSETSTNRNIDKPKRWQTKTTSRNVDKPKRRQTKTPTNQNTYKPKRRQSKTTNRNVAKPKRRQTKTLALFLRYFVYIIITHALTSTVKYEAWVSNYILQPGPNLNLWSCGLGEWLHFIILRGCIPSSMA